MLPNTWEFCCKLSTAKPFSPAQNPLVFSCLIKPSGKASPEPARWSCDNCQRMSDFDSCQSNRTHTDGLHNWKASQVVQDLLWHLTSAYMNCVYGWVYGRACVRYVITKFSRMDSLPNFVTRGAPLIHKSTTSKSNAFNFGGQNTHILFWKEQYIREILFLSTQGILI